MKTKSMNLSLIFFLVTISMNAHSQEDSFSSVRATVDFSNILRKWDGFGFNYVETAQTYDHQKNPQDYGGFKFLDEKKKREVIELVFGDEGLKPSLFKMFLDPLHQKEDGGAYDHETSTKNMRYFVNEGLKLTRKRGEDLSIISTLYAPPAYITKQKVMRGRDLDPVHKENLAFYLIDWVKFLKEKERFPIKYISLHNEGESWLRWPQDGTTGGALDEGHDYNFFWDPEQTVEMINLLRPLMDAGGLEDVGITNGEYTNWYRFYHWGFAKGLAENQQALDNLSMVTSHGFYVGNLQSGRWYGPHSNLGLDMVRSKKPDIHAWVTSTAWNVYRDTPNGRIFVMDAYFVKEIYGSIYEAKVNGIIPWAGIQSHTQWWKPDPNPGTAIRVYEDGTYEIPKAYYFYKQVSRAGRPGMGIAYTSAMDSEFSIIAFANNGTGNRDSFVLTNTGNKTRRIVIELKDTSSLWEAYRTTGSEDYVLKETANSELNKETDNYNYVGEYRILGNKLSYEAPAGSVTTFFAK